MPTTKIQYNLASLFTFDANLITIANNPAFPRAALKDVRPASTPLAIAHGGFSLYGLELNWGGGVLTPTPFPAAGQPNTPVVSGGLLDLKGGSVVRYVDYEVLQNFDSGNIGTLRVEYIPDYAGSPAATRTIMDLFNQGDNKNRILVQHTAAGNLELTMWDSAAVSKISFSVAYVASAGVSREIEVDFNAPGGATHLFLQGVSIATSATVYARDAVLTTLRVGADNTGATFSDAEFDNLIYFSAILHAPPTYTPNAFISPTVYSLANPDIFHSVGFAANSLSSFLETEINPTAGAIKYTLVIAGAEFWFDTSLPTPAWVISNATYAESNTATEINTNAATAPFTVFSLVQVRAFMNSTNGRATPELESVTLDHTVVASQLPSCKIFGFYKDSSGAGIRKAAITFSLVQPAQRFSTAGSGNTIFVENEQIVETDDMGFFEVNLVRSSEFVDPLQRYRVSFAKSPFTTEFTVPDATTKDLGTII